MPRDFLLLEEERQRVEADHADRDENADDDPDGVDDLLVFRIEYHGVYYSGAMLEFQEKRRLVRILSSKITIAVLLVLIFFVARGTWGVYQKESDSRKKLVVAERAHAELADRQDALVAQVAALKTERGVEEEIRSRYELSKPGEEVALIVDEATTTEEEVPVRTWWQELLAWAGIGM